VIRTWGGPGTTDGLFKGVEALATAGRHLFVVERGSGRVQVFT
jgi:hypothetical protein